MHRGRELARLELFAELSGRPGEQREGPPVDRENVADAQEVDGDRGGSRVHREMAADRQHRQVRRVELANEPHVAEDRRIARVVDAIPVLELDDEAHRLAEGLDRVAAEQVPARM